ncbi:MAG: hypothetical protein HY290_00145 [Planctomycetia bacterium]|nr:hypothetical protein [Planctomycetia bacterium]
MPNVLLATTLMIALGQTPVEQGAPGYPGQYPAPVNSAAPGYAPGPGYGPGPAYGAGPQYGPGPQYVGAPGYGAPGIQGPGMQGPGGSCGPNDQNGYGGGYVNDAPGSLNNAYLGYRLTPGGAFGEGFGTSTFNYAYPNYDAYEPWVHGQWQDLPAFGGHAYFRPYNYRHVYVHAELATRWGTSGVMPYSHEYFRRPREQGIYEQRTTSAGRMGIAPTAYRQQPRQPQNDELISRTGGTRVKSQQPQAVKQAVNGPSLFPRGR